MPTLEDVPVLASPSDLAINEDVFAMLDLEMAYACANARRRVRLHAPSANMWRDIFPAGLDAELAGKRAGEAVHKEISSAHLAGAHQDRLVRTVPLRQFEGALSDRVTCVPDAGRFLPLGTLYKVGIGGVYRDSLKPYRVLDVSPDAIVADLNAPFAGFDASISISVRDVQPKRSDVGGRC